MFRKTKQYLEKKDGDEFIIARLIFGHGVGMTGMLILLNGWFVLEEVQNLILKDGDIIKKIVGFYKYKKIPAAGKVDFRKLEEMFCD